MSWRRILAAVMTAALTVAVPSLALGQTSQCSQTCTGAYQQCLGGAKAEQACLAGWHQCKARCEARAGFTPVRMAVASKPAAPAKAAVGKH